MSAYDEGYIDGYEKGYADCEAKWNRPLSVWEWVVIVAILTIYCAAGWLIAHALGGVR